MKNQAADLCSQLRLFHKFRSLGAHYTLQSRQCAFALLVYLIVV